MSVSKYNFWHLLEPGFGSKPIKPENTYALEGHSLVLNLCQMIYLKGLVTNLSWWKTDIHV